MSFEISTNSFKSNCFEKSNVKLERTKQLNYGEDDVIEAWFNSNSFYL